MANVTDRLSGRAARRRASALHPLHLGHHRKAEGRRAHDRRLFGRHLHHHEVGLRSQGRRYLLVHRRHRLGDRTQLHRLRSAAERRDRPDVRRRAELSRPRSLLGIIDQATRSTSSTPRPRRFARSSSGASSGRESTTSSSLRLLGTVGEPINPEAWMWYREVIGNRSLPDRRYLVADGNRAHHDFAASRARSRPSRARQRVRFPASCRGRHHAAANACR